MTTAVRVRVQKAVCVHRRLVGEEALSYCLLTEKCCEGDCLTCEAKELVCPNCGDTLNWFNGIDYMPHYAYCPKCNDWGYEPTNGQAVIRLVANLELEGESWGH